MSRQLSEKQLGLAPPAYALAYQRGQYGALTVLNDDFDEPDRASPCLGEEFLQLFGGYKNKKHGEG